MNTLLAAATITVMSSIDGGMVLDIDDDGFSMEPAPAEVGFTVDIDDDGWSRVPVEATTNVGGSAPADCTPLELSIGVDQAACGTYSAGDLARMKFEADSDD